MYLFLVQICKLFVAVVFSVSSLFSFTPANREIAEIKASPLALPDSFTVTAHAGAMSTIDNSMWSVRQIIASGVDVIEMDMTFRPDGTPVIKHDDEPSQNQGTLFSDVLEAVSESDTIKMNLDLKSVKNLPAVQDLLEEYGMLDRAFFTGVEEGRCAQVRDECPLVPYYLNASTNGQSEDIDFLYELADKAIALGAVGLNINFGDASRELCEVMREKGLLVSVWTVNTKLDMYKMLALGVDNITTKKPLTLLKVISDWQ